MHTPTLIDELNISLTALEKIKYAKENENISINFFTSVTKNIKIVKIIEDDPFPIIGLLNIGDISLPRKWNKDGMISEDRPTSSDLIVTLKANKNFNKNSNKNTIENNIEINTPIIVWNKGLLPIKKVQHFARFNKNGRVEAFRDGRTSHTEKVTIQYDCYQLVNP